MNLRQRFAGRKITNALGRAFRRRKMAYAGRKRRAILRTFSKPIEPTHVETFKSPSTVGVGGQVFKVRMSDIPQVAQYMNLYKQYRINWVKVILVPEWNYDAADANQAIANGAAGLGTAGMARIVFAVNDSPSMPVPATEAEVLQDNGCKIQTLRNKWSCSFKPVPDVQQTTAVGTIYTRQKFRQWFNYDPALAGNNPEHGAVSAFISHPSTINNPRYHLYYKVSFSLRDPQ